MIFREINFYSCIVRTIFAIIVGGILGWERGLRNRPAGFRTHMLVCLGAAIVMMTNQYVYQTLNIGDPVRMGAQVISGIGFLGAGTIIITGRNQIRGLTTAAGLWTATCIGLAIGIGFYEGAIIGAVASVCIVALLHRLDVMLKSNSLIIHIYVELMPEFSVGSFLEFSREIGLVISDIQFKNMFSTDLQGQGFFCSVHSNKKCSHLEIIERLRGSQITKYIEQIGIV